MLTRIVPWLIEFQWQGIAMYTLFRLDHVHTSTCITNSGNTAYSVRRNTQPMNSFTANSYAARMPTLFTAASRRKLSFVYSYRGRRTNGSDFSPLKLGWEKNGRNALPGREKEIKNGGTRAQSDCVLFIFAFLGSNHLIANVDG